MQLLPVNKGEKVTLLKKPGKLTNEDLSEIDSARLA
jgi:hypothetical protein